MSRPFRALRIGEPRRPRTRPEQIREDVEQDRQVGQVVHLHVCRLEKQRGIRTQIELQLSAHRPGVGHRPARTVLSIGLPPVVVVVLESDARPCPVAERPAHRKLHDFLVEVAVLPACLEIEFVGRLAGYGVHQSTRRVAPEQRALRTPQHFDTLEVEELYRLARIGRLVYLVHIERDLCLTGVLNLVDADTPYADAVYGTEMLKLQVRDVLRHLFGLFDTQRPQLFAAERADRDGHILEVLLPLLRGYEDFFDDGLGKARGRQERQQQHGNNLHFSHCYLPSSLAKGVSFERKSACLRFLDIVTQKVGLSTQLNRRRLAADFQKPEHVHCTALGDLHLDQVADVFIHYELAVDEEAVSALTDLGRHQGVLFAEQQ